MPRPCRLFKPGCVYHLIARGNNKQVIFREAKDFQKYLYLVQEAKQGFSLLVYNYVLMNNHIHLLVGQQGEGPSVSMAMEYIDKGYAKYFNYKYGYVGHVFQGRFKSFMVLDQWYFFACNRYIDMNPVKAGVTDNPGDHIWSGYPMLAYGRQGIVELNFHDLYCQLGADPAARQLVYRSLVSGNHYDDLDLINRRAGSLKKR